MNKKTSEKEPSMRFEDVESIYELYSERIYKFFYFKFLSKPIAEDLTSETFTAFIEHVNSGKEILNSKSFLYGIAKNIFILKLKDKYKRNEVSLDSIENFEPSYVDEFVEEKIEKDTAEEKIKKYIDQLPDKQREIITLRLIDKLNLKDICEKLGKDMNYVKTTQKRAIRSLKQLIECTL